MKKMIVAIVLALLATTVQASSSCRAFSDYAGVLMGARQQGLLATEILEGVCDKEPGKNMRELCSLYVMQAWAIPRMEMAENQLAAINDFRDAKYVECAQYELTK